MGTVPYRVQCRYYFVTIDMTDKHSLDDELAEIRSSGRAPRLLLHCCCAPCASHVLELLAPLFRIAALFYNPNISPREEYDKRAGEFKKLLAQGGYPNSVEMVLCDYSCDEFEAVAMPYRDEPEGGLRCRACFGLRLREAARRAKEGGFEYFATTLSVGPRKSAAALNEIGGGLAAEFGVRYLAADFKKRDGYRRSVELSRQFGLYRQSYCGCTPKARS